MAQPLSLIVVFGVRNSKDRGILIESLATTNDEFFFKFHDQPLNRHCEQVQNIIRAANVKTAKKVPIDIAAFSIEYIQNNKITFKATALNSVNKQIGQVCNLNINKEIGAMKRSVTIAANKQRKIAEKMEAAEALFQIQRAKRIHEMFGGQAPHGSQRQGTSRGSGTSQVQIARPVASVTPPVPDKQGKNQHDDAMDHDPSDDDDDL